MIRAVLAEPGFQATPVVELWHQDSDQVLVFRRGDLVFAFNWSPNVSYTDYGVLAPAGEYRQILDSDAKSFGGNGFLDPTVTHFTNSDPLYDPQGKGWLKLYLPARTAVVLRRIHS